MRQLSASLLALALGGAAAVALVSCGSGSDADLLPGGTASEINANLDMVRELADSGDCAGAQSAAQQVSDQIDALGGVDKRLKQALRDGAERLNDVVADCVEATETIAPATIPKTTETTTKPPKEKEKKPKKDKSEAPPATPITPTTPPETTPTTPAVPPTPPTSGGGTGAPGGVAPGAPVGEGDG